MTLHKLSAGTGYTYLTRQVAANDATEIGYANLGEYYSERGESPGVWLGHGLAALKQGPAAGDRVHEHQMIALFGHGRHPNARRHRRVSAGQRRLAEQGRRGFRARPALQRPLREHGVPAGTGLARGGAQPRAR
ncbi:MAG: relaxase domain-containing protein [Mycobacteriales bacterium]|nr:MAG: hypothetical protein DLM56_04670 [Pseudonocardiales bacterium]